jgi:hypothetical protein
LKWLAFQEYLLYRCRNGLTDDTNHSWLDSLCQRSEEQVLPCVRSALLARLKTLGETFADDFKSLVAAPNVFLHEFDPAFSYLVVGRNNGSAMQPSTQLQQSQQVRNSECNHEQLLTSNRPTKTPRTNLNPHTTSTRTLTSSLQPYSTCRHSRTTLLTSRKCWKALAQESGGE